MTFEQVLSVIQTISLVLAIFVALGTLRGRGDDKATVLAVMQTDIKYIKEKIESVDGIRDVANCAATSAKSAHKRLDDHLRHDHHKDVPNRED